MRILKKIAIVLLSFVGLILLIGLFVSKEFTGVGHVVVNKPHDLVYNYVSQLKNQHEYGVWFRMDPNIVLEYQGVDAQPGSTLIWKSKKVGDGKQVITSLIPNERVDIDVYLNGSNEPAKSFMSTERISDNQTKVTWSIKGEIPYPVNILTLFITMNKDFQQGVENLKINLEKQ